MIVDVHMPIFVANSVVSVPMDIDQIQKIQHAWAVGIFPLSILFYRNSLDNGGFVLNKKKE